MSLKAPVSCPTSSCGGDRSGRGQIAARDGGRRRGEAQDRSRHLPGDEPDADGQEQRREQPDHEDRQGQLLGRSEGLGLRQLHDEGVAVLIEPAVDADDRGALVVRVQRLAGLAGQGPVDAGRLDAVGELALVEPGVDEAVVLADEIRRPALAEPVRSSTIRSIRSRLRLPARTPTRRPRPSASKRGLLMVIVGRPVSADA